MRRRFTYRFRLLRWALAPALALAAPGLLPGTETARLVRDINPSTGPSNPSYLGEHGGRLYFAHSGEAYGLWVTDGTRDGSRRLTRGFGGYTPWSQTQPVVSAGRYAFFSKRDAVLWRTDGTREGTRPVHRFEQDWCGYKCIWSLAILGSMGDRVFLSAFESSGGRELWVSDGTTTRRLRDIAPGRERSDPSGFATTSRLAFFTAHDPAYDVELWVTDGTTGGTRLVADINPAGPSHPQELTAVGDTLFFTADDGHRGRALWATDGTTRGTRLVRVIRAGRSTSDPRHLVEMGGNLYFTAWQGGQNRLWRSDGTGAGTLRVADLGYRDQIAATGDRVFFDVAGADGGAELWATDGSEGGARRVKVIRSAGYSPQPTLLTPVGDELYFVADDGVHGEELWKSDGTETGTKMLADLRPGNGGSDPRWITAAGGKVFFSADDGRSGTELWYAAAGEVRRVDDFGRGSVGSDIESLIAAGPRVFFRATDGLHGFEPWSSDGTREGTRGIDVCPGACPSIYPYGWVHPMAAVGDTVFFQANDGQHGAELWKSDGSAEGTVLVKDIASNDDNGSTPGPWRDEGPGWGVLGGRLFFRAWQAATGSELWVTDGSEDGTRLVADIRPEKLGSSPTRLVAAEDRLFFVADDGETGAELWISDGSAEGTRRAADIRPGPESSAPRHLAARGREVFFDAHDGVDREIWRSDGTAAGTFRITDLGLEVAGREVCDLAVAGERVVFVAGQYNRGYQYWGGDGSAGGETLLVELETYPDHFLPVGERVFFAPAPWDPQAGLWVTDGTVDGTRRLLETGIERPLAANGRLYFTAPTNRHYTAIWESDGTLAGTRPLVEPPFALGYFTDMAATGDTLYFVGEHPRHGAELFAVDLAAVSGSAGLVALADLDGLGGGEVAALAPGAGAATVVDAESGAIIGRSPVDDDGAWQPLEVEALTDLDGNGAPEIAILARRRDQQRIFVHDALTGRRSSTLRLGRDRRVLDLEPAPDGRAVAVLTTDPADHRRWHAVVLDAIDGAELARVDFSYEQYSQTPVDFEVFNAGGEIAAAVLLDFAFGDLGRLVARGLSTGRVLADWTQDAARPQDLEILGPAADATPRAVILATRQRARAVRVQITPLDRAPAKRLRFGRRFEALDMAVLPGAGSALVSVLLDTGGAARVVTRRAGNGRKRSTIDFPGVSEAAHLALLAPDRRLPAGAAAVVGRGACGGGGYALVVRDLATGRTVSCSALAPDAD